MTRSIFIKLFAVFLLLIILLSTLVLLITFSTIKNFHLDTLTYDLNKLTAALTPQVIPLMEKGRVDDLDSLIKNMGNGMNTRITVIAPDGLVLADSDEDPALMENHGARVEVIQALGGITGRSQRYSTTVGEEMLYVANPLLRNGEVIGVLRVSLYLKEIRVIMDDLKMKIARMVLLVVVIALIGTVVFSKSFSNRIRQLSKASEELAGGDFDVRVSLGSRDELEELAQSFNHMALTMKELFRQVTDQKEKLDSVFSSIRGGLVVIDRNGIIDIANHVFKEIVQSSDIEGKPYWEVLREPGFCEIIERVRETGKNLLTEIEIRDKFLLCSAAFLSQGQEIVLVLHDVTDIKYLERVKKDFVMNVSHELRTPLTVIKGFAETLLEEEDREKRKKYIEIITRHTDRLTDIVNDLLTLAELEEEEKVPNLEEVDLKSLISRILKVFEQKLRGKENLDVHLDIRGDLSPIRADPFRLEQMFINLIDNAIKYTEQGEIRIVAEQVDSRVSIRIKDSGIGIPEEHQARIFERFYVVDRSRTRELGGTGLGLSIVKHIVLQHNGEISVTSTPGGGTTFTILLPV